jgi:putative ABC transport system substrate-binding protein
MMVMTTRIMNRLLGAVALGLTIAGSDIGLLPTPGLTLAAQLELIPLAAQIGLPAIYMLRSLPANGGLLSHDTDFNEVLRGAATYADRLLRGARVSDLPVQYPTKFGLVINLKTAKALGLAVPTSMVVRADEVIE